MIADLPPRIELVDPPEERIQLPVNSGLPLAIRAEDPDFALREVIVRAVLGDRSLPIHDGVCPTRRRSNLLNAWHAMGRSLSRR